MKKASSKASAEFAARDYRPTEEVDTRIFEAVANYRKKTGRPPVEFPKTYIGFRLSADLVASIKATGRGYNTRVEKVLREALEQGRLEA